jgi:hypothetical protein
MSMLEAAAGPRWGILGASKKFVAAIQAIPASIWVILGCVS